MGTKSLLYLSKECEELLFVRIGHISNCKFDISVKGKDGVDRGIQIKMLTEAKTSGSYYFCRKKYPIGTLIIGVQRERQLFSTSLVTDVGYRSYFNFLNPEENYSGDIFFDEIRLSNRVRQLIPSLIDISKVEIMSLNFKSEFSMVTSLQKATRDHDLKFERSKSSVGVDCSIGEYSVELKSSSRKNCHTFRVHLSKYINKKEAGSARRPLTSRDMFDFLIVMFKDKEDEMRYSQRFCIIPFRALIEQEIIRTDNCSGKEYVMIAHPECHNPHWTLQFWDRWDLLKSPKTN